MKCQRCGCLLVNYEIVMCGLCTKELHDLDRDDGDGTPSFLGQIDRQHWPINNGGCGSED